MTTKRSSTQQFKDEAVRLVLQEELSVPQVARRIEISDKTLANLGTPCSSQQAAER